MKKSKIVKCKHNTDEYLKAKHGEIHFGFVNSVGFGDGSKFLDWIGDDLYAVSEDGKYSRTTITPMEALHFVHTNQWKLVPLSGGAETKWQEEVSGFYEKRKIGNRLLRPANRTEIEDTDK